MISSRSLLNILIVVILLHSAQSRPVPFEPIQCALRNLVTTGRIRFDCNQGYKPDCSSCSSSHECRSNYCYKGKCVISNSAYKKCSLPTCSSCGNNYRCASGKCWGTPRKCVPSSNYSDLLKCGFKKECAVCTSSLQCATMKCWGPGNGQPNKCTFDTSASKGKCFKPITKPDCSPCSPTSKCGPGKKCWGSPLKCVPSSATYNDLLKCGYKGRCSRCTHGLQCATKFCTGGKCASSHNDYSCGGQIDPIDPCGLSSRRSDGDRLIACP